MGALFGEDMTRGVSWFHRKLEDIKAKFEETGDYKQLYQDHAQIADEYWEDTSRRNYEADLWYNRNRNEICLEMLGDICHDKKVLAVGARHWIEQELLAAINAKEVIRTDIVGDDGVIEADASALPFDDVSFDMVICRELIEHVLDEQAVFDEINRVLRPQGLLLITTPNAFSFPLDGIIHRRAYMPSSFLGELKSQGFEVIKKRGNVPYILSSLLPMAEQGFTQVLGEFKDWDKRTRVYEDRYYVSTQMFVLCQKGGR